MTTQSSQPPQTSGLFASGYPSIFGTHLMWGMLPLYFALTAPASAFEVVAARVLFSIVVCAVVLTLIRGGWRTLRASMKQKKLMGALAIASVLIGCNWLLYVIATTSGHTFDASLGYFINPLVSVMLGVIFLGERLRTTQWVAIGIATFAVIALSVLHGQVPWIGLGLAGTFGFYGLVKSKVGKSTTPIHSFAVESALLAPLAFIAMLWFEHAGTLTLFNHGPAHFFILAASGIVTTAPLLLFADAAAKLPLSIVGMVQYLNPTLQFLIALLVFHDPLSFSQLLGFILIWIACLIFTADMIRHSRVQRRQVRLAHAAATESTP